MLAVSEPVFAEDELYLCGIVKEVQSAERIVRVQVISEGCAGDKTFKVSRELHLDKFITGENTCFMINMSICPQHQVATILAE
jgi:hypothetical protein